VIAAFVLIKAAPGRVADLASELTDVEGVAEVYSVTGDHDLIVVVRVRSHDDLAQVVPGNLSSLPGILETQTMVAFKAYSRHDLDSMWSLGAG
jgi:DNA-binding Lrp family transcriptional regulator